MRTFKIPARKSKDKRKRQSKSAKLNFSEANIVRQIVLEEDAAKQVSMIAKRKHLPVEVLKNHIREQTAIINEMISENRILLMEKSLAIINRIDPDKIHPNSRPLAAAILYDKAIKSNDALKDIVAAEPTIQENLVNFLKTNNITFDQLTHITHTGQCPEAIPIEIFRRLQDLLRNRPAHTIDLPPNPSEDKRFIQPEPQPQRFWSNGKPRKS